MNTKRTNLIRLILLTALVLPAVAMADVQGTGFDGMPPGPYSGSGVITGDPSTVTVVPAASLGGSTPPGATGNVLSIDNRNGSGVVTVTFTFDCDGTYPDAVCQIEYDFFFEAWLIGSWIGVYVDDDGTFSNPDDLFEPPVGFPPSTSWGDNTEREPDCFGTHTITFVVGPGAVAYLDNFDTECLDTVASETADWGTLKSMYR
ncbi:hypothetical protein KKG45_08805 [bacterium]|nr:hypothetical protein [bacterium]MBU1073333.1 hypothetical protein [bacterium]MBU1676448.1 hypothetical protein [bacterium]